jgi:carbamoyltransferase
MPEFVLALGGSNHDFSCALMRDRDIVVAIEEERLSRRKHGVADFYTNPVRHSIAYCLAYAGITLDDVAVIVSSDLLPGRVRHELRDRPLRLFPHHLCHAASVLLMLPPQHRAAILIYDGMGSIIGRLDDNTGVARNVRETFSFYLSSPSGIVCLGQTRGSGVFEHDEFPSSLNSSVGMLYEFVTALIGFHHMDAGKTMGLAAHGTPRYLPLFERFVALGASPNDCFVCELDNPLFRDSIEEVLIGGGNTFGTRADLAASVQAVVNNTLVHCISMFDNHDYDYLCLAGGCALNTVATSHLITVMAPLVPVVVPPHASDAGLAFGALYLYATDLAKRQLALTFRGGSIVPGISRPGRTYTPQEHLNAARSFYPRLAFDASVTTATDLAHRIAEGEIVGVLNGPSEIGPRALGGRSILADPRSAITRELINRQMKEREPFRPLAPMILASAYDDFFHNRQAADPFMLKVSTAKERCRREAPAVVHVDGTARVQVVPEDGDPFLLELLTEFGRRTGVPMVLNTSFNRRGEPIVETPTDAIDAFLGMNLHGLFLDGFYVRPASADKPSTTSSRRTASL